MTAKAKKKPAAIVIDGERYPATVLKVTGRDPDGSPRDLQILRDDESVTLEGGEAFWVVFAPPGMSRRRN